MKNQIVFSPKGERDLLRKQVDLKIIEALNKKGIPLKLYDIINGTYSAQLNASA